MIRRYGEPVVAGQIYRRRPGVYAILLRGDDILLTHQAEPDNEFQLPGGGIDPGEHPLPALHREVMEETGISARPEDFRDWALANVYEIYPVWRHRYAPGVTRNTEHVFSLCVPPGTAVTLSPREHRAWQWLPWQAAADTCFSASNAEACLLPDSTLGLFQQTLCMVEVQV